MTGSAWTVRDPVGAEPGQADAPLYLLMSWLSPAFPVGAFSYSHGLERAVEDGTVRDRASAQDWIRGVLRHGAGRQDAAFLRLAHDRAAARDPDGLCEVNALAVALSPSAERHLEATAQGRAFLSTVLAAWPDPTLEDLARAIGPGEVTYPVAVGVAAAAHRVPADAAAIALLHAFAANLVSAAVRLVPLGQTDGQRITAALAGHVHAVAAESAALAADEIGGIAIAADVASMRHETQYTRLFRS